MGKKKKTEFFDDFCGYTWDVEGPYTAEEIISYVKTHWLDPHDAVLKDFNDRHLLKHLAKRYAHGETFLTARTQAARSEYLNIFNQDLLPKEQRRRIVDAISSRIKDILPNLATRVAVEEVIQSNPKLDDSEIASLMYDLVVEKKTYSCNIPNTSFVKNIRAQMDKNGGVLPEFEIDPTTKFVLSVTDQLAEVKRTGENRNFLELSLKMKRKVAKLIFKLPNKERYLKGKPCLPDIVRTAKNKQGVAFDFSIKHTAPIPYEPLCSLGADVGVVYPVVSALVGDGWYSQAMYPPGHILDLVSKLKDLAFQKSVLEMKIEQDSMPNRIMHDKQRRTYKELVEIYTRECQCIIGKMTDIKKEIARWAAHSLCETAYAHKAQIVFEQLNWSNPSHAFFYSMMQERTRNLAFASGIPVITVSAKDTSAKCSHDGSLLVQNVKEQPPAVKSGTKQRNDWRSVDRKSGLRDPESRRRIVKEKKSGNEEVNEFSLPFSNILSEHAAKSGTVSRGAKCAVENVVRDHDCIGALNIGVSGEVERGSLSSRHCLENLVFRRVHRRSSNFHFCWAVSLSATAAVSASAPAAGSASVSNDAVGILDGGSPAS